MTQAMANRLIVYFMRIGNQIKKKMNGKDNSEWTYPNPGKDVCNRTDGWF